jgi:hypothetical protein
MKTPTQEALATFNPETVRIAGLDLLEYVANDAPNLSAEELYIHTIRAAEVLRLAWLLEDQKAGPIILRTPAH